MYQGARLPSYTPRYLVVLKLICVSALLRTCSLFMLLFSLLINLAIISVGCCAIWNYERRLLLDIIFPQMLPLRLVLYVSSPPVSRLHQIIRLFCGRSSNPTLQLYINEYYSLLMQIVGMTRVYVNILQLSLLEDCRFSSTILKWMLFGHNCLKIRMIFS